MDFHASEGAKWIATSRPARGVGQGLATQLYPALQSPRGLTPSPEEWRMVAETVSNYRPPSPDSPVWLRRDRLDYTPVRSAAAAARHRTRAILGEWGLSALADDAEAIIGELVQNALRASERDTREWTGTKPGIRIWTLQDRPARVTFLMWDAFKGLPEWDGNRPSDESEDGRGLLIVNCLSDMWGYFPAKTGKWTWATLGAEKAPGSGYLA